MSPLAKAYLRSKQATRAGDQLALVAVRHQAFVNPATIDADGYVVDEAGPNATTKNMTLDGTFVSAGVGRPDFPRNVVVTVDHASSVVACNGVITGTDVKNNPITEAWSVTAGTTQKVFTGVRAFKTITQISVTAAGNATTNTIDVGTGKKLGLDMTCSSVVAVAEEQDGAAPTAGVIVKGSTTGDADRRGTYTPNATLNGALDFDIWYLVDDPWDDTNT
jgi:hypothetical protein